MICRVKLNIEMYQTMTQVCQDCLKNSSQCDNSHCASADGQTRGIITANRQLPGPPIQVCQNDVLVVDVINRIPGHSVTIHWRGQPNHEAPFMDGAANINQCPINSYTTFQYKFRASSPGTHLYHAYSDNDRTDGLFGALIVRQADKIEPQRKLYDIDAKEHILLISEWSGDLSQYDIEGQEDTPKALLINGKVQSEIMSSMSRFQVKKGKRHRFRVGYASGALGCPVVLSIDHHLMKIISLDGNPTIPYEVSSVTLAKGERLDFVLKANQAKGAYFVRVKSNCAGNKLEGLGVINYKGVGHDEGKSASDVPLPISKGRVFDSTVCDTKIGRVCLTDVKSLKKMPKELREYEVARKVYLGFDAIDSGLEDKENRVYTDWRSKTYRMNNITFTYPSAPLLTQPEETPPEIICNEKNTPAKCVNSTSCECIHVEEIPLGATTEIILLDQGGGQYDEHIFHLHGYHFYVVGSNVFDTPITLAEVKALDSKDKLVKRNLVNAVLKDTVRVPKFGVVVLRFIANNPGFWMLRDEQSKGWTRGLDLVLQVGEMRQMVATPTGFPACGNFIGPDFFLL